MILAPLVQKEVGEFRDVIEKLKREGFVRVRIDGEIIELGRPEPIRLTKDARHDIEVVIDRLVIRDGVRTRLADSVDTALKWGANRLVVLRSAPVDISVAKLCAERIGGPLAAIHRHHVAMRHQKQRASASGAFQSRDEVEASRIAAQ